MLASLLWSERPRRVGDAPGSRLPHRWPRRRRPFFTSASTSTPLTQLRRVWPAVANPRAGHAGQSQSAAIRLRAHPRDPSRRCLPCRPRARLVPSLPLALPSRPYCQAYPHSQRRGLPLPSLRRCGRIGASRATASHFPASTLPGASTQPAARAHLPNPPLPGGTRKSATGSLFAASRVARRAGAARAACEQRAARCSDRSVRKGSSAPAPSAQSAPHLPNRRRPSCQQLARAAAAHPPAPKAAAQERGSGCGGARRADAAT